MATRKLLVTGATGKQGGALIEALLADKAPFQILALTRNTASGKAESLASNPNVTIVQGDSSSPAAIFEAHKPIYGVFCITVIGKDGAEEAQALPLIDESIKNGVEHYIFSSVDRGGAASDHTPTNIEHFASKHRIEQYLMEESENGKKMPFTILRPVAFMDNMTPGLGVKGFASLWAGLGDKPLQLVSCRDIGLFAARAFQTPSMKGRSISLAGDALTLAQGKKVFRDALGYDMPETFGFVGTALKFVLRELGTMFNWFRDVGCKADVEECRREEPRMQTFGTWLKESSAFEKR